MSVESLESNLTESLLNSGLVRGVDAELARRVAEATPDIFVEALGVEEGQVRSEALLDYLGAESIDYLDLTFRYEKRLGLPIPSNSISIGSLKDKAVAPDYEIKSHQAAIAGLEPSKKEEFDETKRIDVYNTGLTVRSVMMHFYMQLEEQKASRRTVARV